jgi:hypothetical protein
MSEAAPGKRIEVQVFREHDARDRGAGDPEPVRQILLPLISAAVRFTHAGLVVVHFGTAEAKPRFTGVESSIAGLQMRTLPGRVTLIKAPSRSITKTTGEASHPPMEDGFVVGHRNIAAAAYTGSDPERAIGLPKVHIAGGMNPRCFIAPNRLAITV